MLAELARQRDATLNAINLGRVVDAMGVRRSRDWIETQLPALGGAWRGQPSPSRSCRLLAK